MPIPIVAAILSAVSSAMSAASAAAAATAASAAGTASAVGASIASTAGAVGTAVTGTVGSAAASGMAAINGAAASAMGTAAAAEGALLGAVTTVEGAVVGAIATAEKMAMAELAALAKSAPLIDSGIKAVQVGTQTYGKVLATGKAKAAAAELTIAHSMGNGIAGNAVAKAMSPLLESAHVAHLGIRTGTKAGIKLLAGNVSAHTVGQFSGAVAVADTALCSLSLEEIGRCFGDELASALTKSLQGLEQIQAVQEFLNENQAALEKRMEHIALEVGNLSSTLENRLFVEGKIKRSASDFVDEILATIPSGAKAGRKNTETSTDASTTESVPNGQYPGLEVVARYFNAAMDLEIKARVDPAEAGSMLAAIEDCSDLFEAKIGVMWVFYKQSELPVNEKLVLLETVAGKMASSLMDTVLATARSSAVVAQQQRGVSSQIAKSGFREKIEAARAKDTAARQQGEERSLDKTLESLQQITKALDPSQRGSGKPARPVSKPEVEWPFADGSAGPKRAKSSFSEKMGAARAKDAGARQRGKNKSLDKTLESLQQITKALDPSQRGSGKSARSVSKQEVEWPFAAGSTGPK